ncbi:MAG: hypothetical protein K2Q24_15430 [Chitinophagaceae bacterium]|nr:hypothetical protein [Chitinophagaceae bacterium]
MIPDFTREGLLPPGIHQATLLEFEKRFVNNVWRKDLFGYLMKLIADLRSIGCKALYIDGSFTTNKRLPKDFDVCWEDLGLDYNEVQRRMPILFDLAPPRTKQQLLYRSDIFPAHYMEHGSKKYFIDFFQEDKYTRLPKGIIKLDIT